jgi:thiamine-phosphate pyrophosphorylase
VDLPCLYIFLLKLFEEDEMRNLLKLCLVTNIQEQPLGKYLSFLELAARGGITMVQLREKGTDLYEVKAKALAIQKILTPYGIPLIINDHVELAAEINADGVHLGQQDMNIEEARKIFGPNKNKIFGCSIESLEELKKSNQEAWSYVTASAIYPSITKPECKMIWGRRASLVVKYSKHPVTGIGGINLENVASTIEETGICGIAVVGVLHRSNDPFYTSSELRSILDQYLDPRQPILNAQLLIENNYQGRIVCSTR